MRKLASILIAIFILAIIIVSILKFTPFGKDLAANKGGKQQLWETKEVTESTEEAEEATTEEVAEEAAESTEEATAEEATTEETASVEETTFDTADTSTEEVQKTNEFAYIEDVTVDDIEQFKTFYDEANVDFDEGFIERSLMTYELANYERDDEQQFLVPVSFITFRENNANRHYSAVQKGLQKDMKPIDDALSEASDLTPEEVKMVLAAKNGETINFTAEEIQRLDNELYKELLENIVLCQAYIYRELDLQIGEDTKASEHWHDGVEFKELFEAAVNGYIPEGETLVDKEVLNSIKGKGLPVFARKVNGVLYWKQEYLKYPLSLINLLDSLKEHNVMVLTAKAGDHWHLVEDAESNNYRQATRANYDETLASLVWDYYLKNGKIGVRRGTNLRDKRPEVLTYITQSKPKATTKTSTKKKTTKKKTTSPVPEQKTEVAPEPEQKQETQPEPEQKEETQPEPEQKEETEPEPEKKKKKEEKHPDEGSASSDNADTGGGQNDDSGSGEKKPDQDNSSSGTTDGSQYQQGNSENTSDKTDYDQGKPADNTDNGKAPDTKPIVTDESTQNDNYGGSTAGDNNGAMPSGTPSVDD